MSPGHVCVFVIGARGKPRVSTHCYEQDCGRVQAALEECGRGSVVKEIEEWSSKLREKYIAALKKRGLTVTVIDNRSATIKKTGESE